MVKKGLSLALLLLLTVPAIAQQKMCDVISTMPDSLIPYLSENNRLDMIDFKEANMKAEVHNALEGKTELMVLTDSYASITLNEAHRLQLRLLDVAAPVDSCQQILCVVDTYGRDIHDSSVRFFSLRWRQLPTDRYVSLPATTFTAELSDQQPTLLLNVLDYLDAPATEEQKRSEGLQTNLKWTDDTFK